MPTIIFEITITTPEEITEEQFVNGVAQERNYPEMIYKMVDDEQVEVPNPQSKLDYLKARIATGEIAAYKANYVKQASQSAREAFELVREEFSIS